MKLSTSQSTILFHLASSYVVLLVILQLQANNFSTEAEATMSLSAINNLVTDARRKIRHQLKEITPADKLLFVGMFPNDVILEQKLHCMTCNSHLGTSLEAAQSINTHPVLRTTQCSDCLDLYVRARNP